MNNQELIEKFRKAESSLFEIDTDASTEEIMRVWDEKQERMQELRNLGCEAIYQNTKDVNSRSTIFQVYGKTLKTHDLEYFLRTDKRKIATKE